MSEERHDENDEALALSEAEAPAAADDAALAGAGTDAAAQSEEGAQGDAARVASSSDVADDDAREGDAMDAMPDDDDGAPGVPVREPAAPDAPVLSVDDAAKLIEHGGDDEPATAEGDAATTSEPVAAPSWLPQALEALVFAAPEPLPASRLREVLADEGHDFPLAMVKRALSDLVEKWASVEHGERGAGLRLVETGAGFAFRTAPDSAQFLRRFFAAKPQRLSRAALEALAIIAYRQPVTRPQIDEIRGVDSAGALKNLLDRKLIRVLGKADDVGRPLIYGTTRAFLDFFSLQSLSDLPTLKDYQDLKGGAGVPEPLPTRDDGPVKVMDLFDPMGSGDLVSKETEEESAKALAALESALGQATHVTARALAFEKGDLEAAAAMPVPERVFVDDDDEDARAHAASERLRAEGLATDGSAEAASSDASSSDASTSDASSSDASSSDGASSDASTSDGASSSDEASDVEPVRARVSDEGSRYNPRTLVRDDHDGRGPHDESE